MHGGVPSSLVCLSVMLVMALTGTARAEPPPGLSAAEAKLWVTEEAFAATMAARDHDAFIGFLDPETVFFTGETVLRGRDAVAAAWEPYFEADEAPFAWAPEAAAVVTSGDLGMTSGPIFNRDGERIGTFSSVWRRTADGRWQIVLDRGCP